MPGIKRYVELTLSDLQEVNTQKTICLITVSPIEVHGPHLPLGTDVFIAEKLQSEYCKALNRNHPDFDLLILPPVYAGCDALPVRGSISVRAKTLESLLVDYVRSLANQGFRYLIVCDNHGGPSHQIAMEIVARKVWRRYKFFLINPFNVVYRKMVQHDEAFLRLISLSTGECGDDADCHAGTNETSLMLAANPELVKGYREVPASPCCQWTGIAAVIGLIGNLWGKYNSKAEADFKHLANLLSWVNAPNMPPYQGSPGLATIEAGERMIKGHVTVMSELAARALSGEKPFTEPMLWGIRPFRK